MRKRIDDPRRHNVQRNLLRAPAALMRMLSTSTDRTRSRGVGSAVNTVSVGTPGIDASDRLVLPPSSARPIATPWMLLISRYPSAPSSLASPNCSGRCRSVSSMLRFASTSADGISAGKSGAAKRRAPAPSSSAASTSGGGWSSASSPVASASGSSNG